MILSKEKKLQIEKHAQVLLDIMGKYDDVFWGINLNILAAHFGFDIYEMKMAAELQGDITVDGDVRVIRININYTHELKRFIIAHEFGHFYMTTNKNSLRMQEVMGNIYCGKSIIEEEMDYFAACILMPIESFKKAYKHLHQSGCSSICSVLSQLFCVPIESVVHRIDDLSLIDC